jgi:hypothetical protein
VENERLEAKEGICFSKGLLRKRVYKVVEFRLIDLFLVE